MILNEKGPRTVGPFSFEKRINESLLIQSSSRFYKGIQCAFHGACEQWVNFCTMINYPKKESSKCSCCIQSAADWHKLYDAFVRCFKLLSYPSRTMNNGLLQGKTVIQTDLTVSTPLQTQPTTSRCLKR